MDAVLFLLPQKDLNEIVSPKEQPCSALIHRIAVCFRRLHSVFTRHLNVQIKRKGTFCGAAGANLSHGGDPPESAHVQLPPPPPPPLLLEPLASI
ncbi:hypothetical protein F2P81_022623 [Scophthalmus maximus]|uniref:Uncharacterized protein n=1 Tax=Scophthalmus maximus TaxID=52904 RepID=A0A6A4S336_SCOMX|nr:hypothetical protein F2P81_022623 [Scophthalmus maximus]